MSAAGHFKHFRFVLGDTWIQEVWRNLLFFPYDKNVSSSGSDHEMTYQPASWQKQKPIRTFKLCGPTNHSAGLFVLSRREPVLHFSGTECSLSAPSPCHPPTTSFTLWPLQWGDGSHVGKVSFCNVIMYGLGRVDSWWRRRRRSSQVWLRLLKLVWSLLNTSRWQTAWPVKGGHWWRGEMGSCTAHKHSTGCAQHNGYQLSYSSLFLTGLSQRGWCSAWGGYGGVEVRVRRWRMRRSWRKGGSIDDGWGRSERAVTMMIGMTYRRGKCDKIEEDGEGRG